MEKQELIGTVSSVFNYHHFDDGLNVHCEIPNLSNNNIYLPIKYLDQDDHCGIEGVGAVNIPAGDDTDVPNTVIILPPDGFGSIGGCNACIINEINNAAIFVAQNGGDNPYTYIEESAANNNVLGTDVFYALMAYGLAVAIENEDYNFARSILLPFKAYEWQLKMFGVYMLEGDYDSAKTYNDNLPQNSVEEQNYYAINDINVNRHLELPNKYIMTVAEDQILYNIAVSETPSAGFAASLHRFLTGSSFNDLPHILEATNRSSKLQSADNINFELFPNPIIGNILNIDVAKDNVVSEVILYNSFGNNVIQEENPPYPYQIDIEGLRAGIYYVSLLFDDGSRQSRKVIKN